MTDRQQIAADWAARGFSCDLFIDPKTTPVVLCCSPCPLTVAAAGEPLGQILLTPVAGGCAGYLVNGSDGAWVGVFIGTLVLLAIAMATKPF